MKRWIALVLAAAFALVPAFARNVPATVSMSYTLSNGETMLGTGVETFKSDGKNYSISSEAEGEGIYRLLFGSVKRISQGTITADGLKPDSFDDVRNGKSYAQARFDWRSGKLALAYKGKQKTVPLANGAQDQLSFAYSFAFDDTIAPTVDAHLTNGKKLSLYHYENLGKETIETPLGRLETVHLRRKAEPGKSVSEIWLSPAHHNLPVKVAITDDDDGSRFEQSVTSIDFK
jgi:hypothetical protein